MTCAAPCGEKRARPWILNLCGTEHSNNCGPTVAMNTESKKSWATNGITIRLHTATVELAAKSFVARQRESGLTPTVM
jgi:hypothetical protein